MEIIIIKKVVVFKEGCKLTFLNWPNYFWRKNAFVHLSKLHKKILKETTFFTSYIVTKILTLLI